MKDFYQVFQNPSKEYRSLAFWAWNGELEEEKLLKQVDIMKEMGFGGFFMHSRTGLSTEYLGEKWFRLASACAEKAEEAGITPWIYDEDRWPSGAAGGIVTQNPQFRRKYLTLSIQEKFALPENTLAVFVGKTDQWNLKKDYRRLSPEEFKTYRVKRSEIFLVFSFHFMSPRSEYNGYTDVDRLNLEATEEFLKVTHERYKEKCGNSFEKIEGVFTDEPHRGMVFSDFSDPGEERKWSIPWTDHLPEEFQQLWGYDLTDRLPELFLQLEGEAVSKIKWQYMELLQQLFCRNFLEPIQEWAHRNGKKTTGHFLNEDRLISQAIPCGSMMRCYPYLDIPGVDNLTENRFVPWAVKALESVARQKGIPYKISETFGATGWQMSFQDFKYIGDWQTILGINIRCPHLSWYTMNGEAKRDYPGSFLHQASWYQEYPVLEEYFARLASVLSQGEPICDTLVIHPIESLWCQIHPEWSTGLYETDTAVKKIEEQFQWIFRQMMEAQVDFDYGDESHLAEAGKIVREGNKVYLKLGKQKYRTVILAGSMTIRDTTLRILEEFSTLGGELVTVGSLPAYVSCEKIKNPQKLLGSARRIPMKKKELKEWLACKESVIRVEDHPQRKNIYFQLRKVENGYFAVLWNKSRSRKCEDLLLRLPECACVQRWDCLTGEKYQIECGKKELKVSLEAGQELVLYLSNSMEEAARRKSAEKQEKIPLEVPEKYHLNEENIFVLDTAQLFVETKKIGESDEILNLDKKLRSYLGYELRGGEMIQPWAKEKAGIKPSSERIPIKLKFSVEIEYLPEEPIYLAAEALPEMQFSVNGKRVELKKEDRQWIDDCFEIYQLPKNSWTIGKNILELKAFYFEKNGLESLYLLGNFGVWFHKGVPYIGKLPCKMKHGNLVKQGLPFYSGKITYEYPIPCTGDIKLKLPKIGGSDVIAECQGTKKNVPWAWEHPIWKQVKHGEKLKITVVLNRRNTFGPLHKFPVKQPHITPDSFQCDDLSRYSLYPAGILKMPEIIKLK